MINFEITTPTTILFGKDQLDKLVEQLNKYAEGKEILVLYGGGSIEKFGFLDKLKIALSGLNVHFFKGIEANPEFTTCMKAVELIRSKNIGFLLVPV